MQAIANVPVGGTKSACAALQPVGYDPAKWKVTVNDFVSGFIPNNEAQRQSWKFNMFQVNQI